MEKGVSTDFRIEEKPVFNLAGVSRRIPMQSKGVNQEIVRLTRSITALQRKMMHALQNIEPYEIMNASYDADANFIREEEWLNHMIGVLTTAPMMWAILWKRFRAGRPLGRGVSV